MLTSVIPALSQSDVSGERGTMPYHFVMKDNSIIPALHGAIEAVSPWVARFADQVKADGRVLDVACGGGRHAIFFAQRGHVVDAVDRDVAVLRGALREQATKINLVEADIEDGPWPFAGERYAAVIVTNYLHRPLFPALLAAVEPGGLLIYETFAVGNERYGRPSRVEFLLRPGELLAFVSADFEVIAYENSYVAQPKPAVIQHLAARRRAAPADID